LLALNELARTFERPWPGSTNCWALLVNWGMVSSLAVINLLEARCTQQDTHWQPSTPAPQRKPPPSPPPPWLPSTLAVRRNNLPQPTVQPTTLATVTATFPKLCYGAIAV
jgi:hypothetical protein